MSASINVNITALTTQRYLAISQNALAISMQRLSSGLRINSARDDAAGLAIGSNMTTLIRCQAVAMRNANDEISLSQTKEGALGKMGDLLQRMRELAVQAPNATNSDNDRAALNTEFTQMQDELLRIRKGTSFNGTQVFADNPLDPAVPSGHLTADIATVTSGVNDTLQVTLDGLSASVTLAAGSYTQSGLASAVQSAINNKSTFVSAGASVSASMVNGALSLVSTRTGAGSGVSLAGAATSELFGPSATTTTSQPISGTIDGAAATSSGATLSAAGLTVSALGGSSTGSYTLNVGQLATSGSWLGQVLPGSVSITSGSNDNLTVTLDGLSASVTLAAGTYAPGDLATAVQSAINNNSTFMSAGASVSASITVDGALSLVSASKGISSGISVSGIGASTLINGVAQAGTPTTTLGADLIGSINGLAADVIYMPGVLPALIGASGSAAEGWKVIVGSDSPVGDYAINISQLATHASWLGGGLPPSITITAGVNDQFTLNHNFTYNNYEMTLAAGTYTPEQLASAVQTAINSVWTSDPVSASIVNGALSLVSAEYGQAAYIQLGGVAYDTLSAGVYVPVPYGQDVAGTISNLSSPGFNDSTFSGGQFLTFMPTAAQSVQVLVPGGSTGALGNYEFTISQQPKQGNWIGNALALDRYGTYTITAGVNDTMDVTFGGLSATVTLQSGDFSPNEIAGYYLPHAISSNSTFQDAGLIAGAGIDWSTKRLELMSMTWGKSINLTGGTAYSLLSGVAAATTTSGQNASGTINGAVAVASGQTLTSAAGLSVDVSGASTGSHTINISQLPTQGSWLASGLPGNSANILDDIDAALQQVNTEMVVQGATQIQLASVIANLQTSDENLMEARSRIMDTDYAAETANLARHQIMQQAAMAMLAQANQSPKDVLALLR